MRRRWTAYLLSAALLFLMHMLTAQCLSEHGCVLSVEAQEFVTFNPDAQTLILEHPRWPTRFLMTEDERFGVAQEVLKLPGSLNFFGTLGNALSLVGPECEAMHLQFTPQKLMKIRNRGMCVCTKNGKRHLLIEPCDFYEEDVGQYFIWIREEGCNRVSELLMRLKRQNLLENRDLLARLLRVMIRGRRHTNRPKGRETQWHYVLPKKGYVFPVRRQRPRVKKIRGIPAGDGDRDVVSDTGDSYDREENSDLVMSRPEDDWSETGGEVFPGDTEKKGPGGGRRARPLRKGRRTRRDRGSGGRGAPERGLGSRRSPARGAGREGVGRSALVPESVYSEFPAPVQASAEAAATGTGRASAANGSGLGDGDPEREVLLGYPDVVSSSSEDFDFESVPDSGPEAALDAELGRERRRRKKTKCKRFSLKNTSRKILNENVNDIIDEMNTS